MNTIIWKLIRKSSMRSQSVLIKWKGNRYDDSLTLFLLFFHSFKRIDEGLSIFLTYNTLRIIRYSFLFLNIFILMNLF